MLTNVKNALITKYRLAEELAKFGSHGAAAKRKEIQTALSISRQTLSEYENIPKGDKRMIPFDFVIEICRILGCKAEKFLNT